MRAQAVEGLLPGAALHNGDVTIEHGRGDWPGEMDVAGELTLDGCVGAEKVEDALGFGVLDAQRPGEGLIRRGRPAPEARLERTGDGGAFAGHAQVP